MAAPAVRPSAMPQLGAAAERKPTPLSHDRICGFPWRGRAMVNTIRQRINALWSYAHNHFQPTTTSLIWICGEMSV